MRYSVRYKPAAAAEVANAIAWYSQPEVKQAEAFVRDLERTEAHLGAHPELYQRAEDQIRRAVLRRFPYSLFYVIELDLLFAVWFVYDPAGRPVWYTLEAQPVTSQGPYTIFRGTIYKTNGPYFGGQFDPSQVGIVPSGSGSLYFGNSDSAMFRYVVDGVQGSKNITRQIIE